jgi:tripartite-type tricarboxylate transporter receptor subunit TctC
MVRTSRMAFFLASLAVGAAAIAQDYPSRPVRIIEGYTPGGYIDVIARLVAARLTEGLGKAVIVENRPGANANLAAEMCARATPDGYTTLIVNNALAISAAAYKKLNYDALRDLAPISLIATSAHLLILHPALPARSVKELIALAKAKPGFLNYASSGIGSTTQVPAELLKAIAGVDIVHIPYKGGADAVNAVISGEVSMYFSGITVGLPQAKAGRVRALAVTTSRRSTIAPDIPTMEEAGLPGYENSLWGGLFAPAATPKPVIARINGELVKALKQSDFRDRLGAEGADPVGSTPEGLTEHLKNEIEKYRKLVRALGLGSE